MARKKKPEEHANHERWLVSYADFITLLFAFFVVMYATSEVNKKQMSEVAESVLFAFGQPGSDRTVNPNAYELGGLSVLSDHSVDKESSGSMLPDAERTEFNGLLFRIQRHLASKHREGGLPEGIQMGVTAQGLLIRLAHVNFFDAGGAMLRPEALPMLDSIAEQVIRSGHTVVVQGHSDDRNPGRNSAFTSNWELAATRALSVVQYLDQAGGIPAERLTVTSFGEYRPIGSNTSNEGRARNRRIDLVLSKPKEVKKAPPKPAPPKSPAKPKEPDADKGH